MEAIQFIQDLTVILVVAGVAGWICQRLGLSSVVGFMAAGLFVGPHSPMVSLVTDVPRVDTLAQLGLIFLMFTIGMRLSLRRLRQLGPGLLLAVAVSAGLIFSLTRVVGAAVGMRSIETLFLCGMLMVSSSAIISKVLVEVGVTHDRCGQMAMGVAVLEDVVAVVMLTLLNSIIRFGGTGHGVNITETLGMLSAFVVMAGIAGLLLVPWLLRRMSVAADEELQTLGLGGLLFGLALLAQKAGYSIALGAFLLGTIVAETPHRAQVERIFEGMRDIFTAVFFVAIGMQIEPLSLWHSVVPIVLLSLFSMLVRLTGSSIGLAMVGTPLKDALRTGLMVLPLGEFSFIIVQLGVSDGVIPEKYYSIIVGVSLLTALAAPLFSRRSEPLAQGLLRLEPSWLKDAVGAYHGWLDRLFGLQKRNLIWQLSRKRIIQIGVGMLFVSGVLIFAERLSAPIVELIASEWIGPVAAELLFWVAMLLVILAPLVAIWRNLAAMAMLYAEITAKGHANEARLRSFIQHGLRILAGAGMYVWLSSVLPIEGLAKWMLLLLVIIALSSLILLRRRLIYWHSEMEVELYSILASREANLAAGAVPWLEGHDEWRFAMIDCVIPDLADCRGRSIRELGIRTRHGATIVGIDRQGFMISLPGPDTVLYPRDKVLLIGVSDHLQAAVGFLQRVSHAGAIEEGIADVRMEKLPITEGTRGPGRSLAELAPSTRFGVQVAGLLRGGTRHLNPSSSERLLVGDELLCLGTSSQLRAFRSWMLEAADQGALG